MIITKICEQCFDQFEYEGKKSRRTRSFCSACIEQRHMMSQGGLKLKQKKSQEPVFISWDEPNILGY